MTGKRAIVTAGIVGIMVALLAVRLVRAGSEMDAKSAAVRDRVQSLTPVSLYLLDEAERVLAQGWQGMSKAEREAFGKLFDPAGTGEVDDAYVSRVLENYQKIRAKTEDGMAITYAGEDARCQDMRLYYTDLLHLYVCPYFFEEENELRKARTLIHEMAHAALLVADRPYYRPTSKEYAELTPEGSWPGRLPVVGRLLREVVRDDLAEGPWVQPLVDVPDGLVHVFFLS